MAASLLGKPRFTADVDIVILIDDEDILHILELAGQLSFKTRPKNPVEFAKKNNYKKIFLATASDQKAANKFYTKVGLKRIYSPPDELPHSSTDDIFYEIDF